MTGDPRFSRTRLLVGTEGVEKLQGAFAAVFGIGGVGSYALEALARAGIGHLLVVDCDRVDPSNINRQLLALDSTVGRPKTEAAVERIRLINPEARVDECRELITPDNVRALIPPGLGYAVDAIDTLDAKVALILALRERGIPFVSCMGAARRINPRGVRVDDIGRTSGCPLARLVRKRLRQEGIEKGVRCVYTSEPQLTSLPGEESPGDHPGDAPALLRKGPLGSLSYLPGIMGLTAAGEIIKDILEKKGLPDAAISLDKAPG